MSDHKPTKTKKNSPERLVKVIHNIHDMLLGASIESAVNTLINFGKEHPGVYFDYDCEGIDGRLCLVEELTQESIDRARDYKLYLELKERFEQPSLRSIDDDDADVDDDEVPMSKKIPSDADADEELLCKVIINNFISPKEEETILKIGNGRDLGGIYRLPFPYKADSAKWLSHFRILRDLVYKKEKMPLLESSNTESEWMLTPLGTKIYDALKKNNHVNYIKNICHEMTRNQKKLLQKIGQANRNIPLYRDDFKTAKELLHLTVMVPNPYYDDDDDEEEEASVILIENLVNIGNKWRLTELGTEVYNYLLTQESNE